MFEGISRKEGLLGYKYMSSFLYAIGWVAFAIFFSLLFILAARKIEDKSYRRLYTFIAYVGLFIGCYSFAEMLIPKPMLQDWFGRNDFPPFIYYTVLVVSALLGTTVFNQFQRLAIQTEEKLKAIIGRLFDFIIIDTPNKIDQSKINEYQVECIEIVNETAEVL